MALVFLAGRGATDKRIKTIDPVYQALLKQKIQGAINSGRCDAASGRLGEHIHQLVSPQRIVALPNKFQYLLAQGRQSNTPLDAERVGGIYSVADAVLVVVVATGQGCIGHGGRKLHSVGIGAYVTL